MLSPRPFFADDSFAATAATAAAADAGHFLLLAFAEDAALLEEHALEDFALAARRADHLAVRVVLAPDELQRLECPALLEEEEEEEEGGGGGKEEPPPPLLLPARPFLLFSPPAAPSSPPRGAPSR